MPNNKEIISSLYQNTYKQSSMYKKELSTLDKRMSDEINRTLANTRQVSGDVDISALFDQVAKVSKSLDKDSLEKMFGEDNIGQLVSMYNGNKFIKEADKEIDTILNYMPSLADAVNVIRTNVLSVDSETKSAVTITAKSTDNSDTTKNIAIMRELHNLDETIETICDNMIKYGEDFMVKYDYKNMGKYIRNTGTSKKFSIGKTDIPEPEDASKLFKESSEFSLEVEFYEGLETILPAKDMFYMSESYIDDFGDRILHEGFKERFNEFFQVLHEDNLIDRSSGDIIGIEKELDVEGCYIQRLDREKAIPLYLNDLFNGVLYIEPKVEAMMDETYGGFTSILNRTNATKQLSDNIQFTHEKNKRLILQTAADKLTKEIDVKFINSNKNLAKEIYLLLKYNADNNTSTAFNNYSVGNFKITYLKPSEVTHFYFDRDPKTNRGRSLLEKSVVPGKLYTSVYIASVVGYLTRGFDKRAYYVTQEVEMNIAETMMNVVNQIKRGNFGIREYNNLDNVINLPGRFNDFVIPVNSSGMRPIEMEVISGQNIDIKSELMDILENMTLMPTSVPPEQISNRQQVEFARRYNTTNLKFYNHSVALQGKFIRPVTKFINKIYQSTFPSEKNIILEGRIKSPAFLTLNVMLDAFDAVQRMIDQAAMIKFSPNAPEEQIQIFKEQMFKKLMPETYGWEYTDLAKEYAIANYSAKTDSQDQNM